MSRIAMIGVGAMGEHIAVNLLKHGHALSVVKSRRLGVADRLRAAGAVLAAMPAEAVSGCEFVILSLPTSNEVESVLLGNDAVVATAGPGALVVDCTTGNGGRDVSILGERWRGGRRA